MFNFSLEWTGETVVFFVLAICIISGAVLMLNFSKVVHMVISIAFSFLGLAGMYILLDAEFVAFVQVLVYTGAISILMIFGIMMTRHDKQDEAFVKPWKETLAAIGCIALFGVLFFSIRSSEFPVHQDAELAQDNTLNIGKQMFTEHVIPFELLSVLLTVAFIGAIVLAKKEADES
ncbi:NADH-quinone oxidoreductase subunit J [Paenibacillus alvei]|uniref:NADH-quinone oxidoreductase subunit J n=1 Tax=Paenibacillus alvei TaxID=44250 RepID=A0ABT4GS47_PAEAL|nr:MULTISPECIES: NADH-quinone oxidoreductase subunit J [Paenibacillus]EJW18453.1 NAD(P)H-quinone oxidoreductase chain 6 [Paenibacillus alvei DSM 29]MCY7485209.1 NADH-quinone oxidoreductase subunit J [Paenibacillus alvei]MCY9539622.1 NADH-quinone oxidoreductase subunit J [Paenibacillus alvei]MCY9703145.1 NADH-quinone oxidoreductase subunit J [Paenibacillus alvei]MCY9735635.1 NADH-quinone oxidoreductase subunit J [Paenibacillus alvei]